MRKSCLTITWLITALLVVNVSLGAATGGIAIRNGHVRGLPPGTTNTSAYMTIYNRGNDDLVLNGASTPAADSVTIHATVRNNGVMSMEHRMSAIVPAGDKLELKPGGLHLMLTGLKKPLREGQNVRINLEFEGGFTSSIELPVVSVLNE